MQIARSRSHLAGRIPRHRITRKLDSGFQATVRGTRERHEVTRRTLQKQELTCVPGTFGDPLRVLENLPGMSRPPYILGVLLVRGAQPEDTGVLLDGVSVALLYHFAGGPSVVASSLIDRIDTILPLILDLARRPGEASIFAAPYYWDYQGRYDLTLGRDRLALTAFGSSDQLKVHRSGTAETQAFSVSSHQGFQRFRLAWGLFCEPPQSRDLDPRTGNPDLGLAQSQQTVAGLEAKVTPTVLLDLQGFYNWRSHLVARSNRFTLREGQSVAARLDNSGRGYVYGLELLIKHDLTEHFYGWIAYTLSRSLQYDDVRRKVLPVVFDQTHILTVVASYKRGGWELGGRFRLTTGRPEAPILGATFDADSGHYVPLTGDAGESRGATFHQLDLRIEKEWTFQAGGRPPGARGRGEGATHHRRRRNGRPGAGDREPRPRFRRGCEEARPPVPLQASAGERAGGGDRGALHHPVRAPLTGRGQRGWAANYRPSPLAAALVEVAVAVAG